MNATAIEHSDASQNYEKMGTEFILPLQFDENIDILQPSPLLWRLINFRLFCSDDCRS
jgi:hypothetical protein